MIVALYLVLLIALAGSVLLLPLPFGRGHRAGTRAATDTLLESRGQFVPIIGNGIERAGFAVTQDAVTRRVWLTRHDWSVVLTPEQADTLSALLWIAAMQADGKRLEGIK